jgi:uncharacterized protein YlzI (FlbEa/FlbD family)
MLGFILVKCNQFDYDEILSFQNKGQIDVLLNIQNIVSIEEINDEGDGCCISMINGVHILTTNKFNEISKKIISSQSMASIQ